MNKQQPGKLRSLASDTAIYGISTIVQRFLTFFLTPFYTNYLSSAEYGETSYIYSILAFANIVYSFGLDTAFFRFYQSPRQNTDEESRQRHNGEVFSLSFTSIAIISGGISLFVVLASDPLSDILRLHRSGRETLVLSASIAFLDALVIVPFAALRMERRAKRFAIAKAFVVVVNIIANIVFVAVLGQSIKGVFLAGVIASIISVLIALPELKRYLTLAGKAINWNLYRELWRFGLPTVPAALSSIILQVADRPIMARLLDEAAVGRYQACYRLGIIMMLLVSVFEQAWKPFYLSEAGSHDSRIVFPRVLTYFTVVAGCIFLFGSLLFEFIIKIPIPFGKGFIYAKEYWGGMDILPVVLIAYYCNGFFINVAIGAYLRKRTKYLPIVTGLAALTNVVLNLVLIPVYGLMGAAYATLGAYFLSAVVMYCFSRRLYPLHYEWFRLFALFAVTFITYQVAVQMTIGMPAVPAIILRICCIVASIPVSLGIAGFFSSEGRFIFTRRKR
jgi:O-antigen/teichoic acid export membrane protein